MIRISRNKNFRLRQTEEQNFSIREKVPECSVVLSDSRITVPTVTVVRYHFDEDIHEGRFGGFSTIFRLGVCMRIS